MEKRPMPQRGPDGRFLPQGQQPGTKNPKMRKPPLLNKCSVLLKNLMSHKYAYVFNEPVDPIKLGVPDYFTVIESPMDLGTIRTKLRASRYSSAEEFAADVRLTFSNALKYNHPGDVVHEMAKTLSKRFESRWKVMEKKAKKRARVRARVRARDLAGAGVRVAAADGVMPQMTYEKMYYIVRRFMEWPGDIPEVVVDFVKRHGAVAMDDSDELQLDLNALSNDRMWELHGLVSRCLEDCDLRPQPELRNSVAQMLMDWPGDIPEVVVDFVKKHGAVAMEDNDELQLDLNALSNDCMWELHGLVSRCLEDCDLCLQPEVQNSDAQAGDYMDVKEDQIPLLLKQ